MARKKETESVFYSLNKALTYQNIALYFIVGTRGKGKTYSAKYYVLSRFFKKGEEFFYLRREKDEMEEAARTFLNDILIDDGKNNFVKEFAQELAEGVLFEKGNAIYYQKPDSDPVVVGHFGFIKKAGKRKSTPFPNVTTLIFDEFLTLARYEKNEFVLFMEFLETVFRLRENYRIFLIANAISVVNPYFEKFNITSLPSGIKVHPIILPDGRKTNILIDNTDKESYKEVKKSTKLGIIGEYTGYSNYALENVFLLDDSKNILPRKQVNAFLSFRYNIYYEGHPLGIYLINDGYYIGKEVKDGRYYCLDAIDAAKTGSLILKKNCNNLKNLYEAFRHDYCLFEDQKSKNVFIELMKKVANV